MMARIAGFSIVFSSSDFIVGREEFTGLHGRQALQAGREGRRPARAKEARLGDAGNGDGVRLVASEHVEMRVVLAYGKTDMAARSAFENQDGAGDRLHRLPEQKRVAGPLGIGAQRAQ